MTKAFIKHISYHLPEKIVANEDLVGDFPEWNAEKIAKKTGILSRRIARPDETAGDLAFHAARKLFAEYRVSPDEVDFILLCTQSPDYFLPTTACILQHKLCIPTAAGALDYNLGCSGYVYGLALAKGLISAGIAKNILLLAAETYNKHIHPSDRGNRSIFGDGASATLVSSDGFAEIGEFSLGTDGAGAENLIVKTGAFRERNAKNDLDCDDGGYVLSSDYLYMNGSEIFNFTLESVPALIQRVLEKNNMTEDNVDRYVFHQANKFMLDTLRKVCAVPKEKFYVNLEKTGNTVSSTIPIALCDIQKQNALKGNVLLAGFGVGYSWGGCVIKIN
jgi:3-oxoacyl-[acyl-carrier-protein] synthase-3